MKFDEAFQLATAVSENDNHIPYKCAKKLRRDILNLENQVLEEPLSVENILKGEVEKTQSKNFHKALYIRENEVKKTVSSRKSRFVESSASDAVYSCSKGKLLPGKYLSLGFAVKALTGSKYVVTLMNRYGRCASSETIHRIDMSLEATINDKKNVVPDGIRKLPFLSTGTAWDNFDINLETPSGKDIIDHTYEICYQKNVVGDLDTQAEVPLEKTIRKRRF